MTGLGDIVQIAHPMQTETCTDRADGDFKTTNQFDISMALGCVGRITGDVGAYYTDKYNMGQRTIGSFDSLPAMPSDSAAATQALARTNPSRPSVDVFTFLGELKDAPRMIFQIGDLLKRIQKSNLLGKLFVPTKRDLANEYLGWTFGWDPLIRDLGKLLDFSEAVDNRIRELESLRSGDLRRTYTTYSKQYEYVGDTINPGPSYSNNTKGRFYYDVLMKQWVRIRYKPTTATLSQLGGDLRHQARSLVFGHTPDISSVWNLLPWSWMIDWFSTTGDYFAANRNHLSLMIDDIAVMSFRDAVPTRWVFTANPQNCTVAVNRGYHVFTKRRRKVNGPAISAFVPFLSQKQWSILSALAVMRFR